MMYFATYQEATSNLLAEGNVDVQYDVNSGVNMGKNLLSFNLIGEHVKPSSEIRNLHPYACPFRVIAKPTEDAGHAGDQHGVQGRNFG